MADTPPPSTAVPTTGAVLTVLTTTDSEAAAQALAVGAVERQVAACAQVSGPLTSYYRWEGAIAHDQEWQVSFKTAAIRYDALETYLRHAHSYDVPEIIATEAVRGSDDYLSWVVAETRPD